MVGVEVGRIYGDVMTDECDAGRAFFYLFDRGVVAVDEDDSNITRVYGWLLLDDDDDDDDVAARCRYFFYFYLVWSRTGVIK